MPKLNDTQTILLSTAAQRGDRSLYPMPDTLTPGARVTKAITGLVKAEFAEEHATADVDAVVRTDGDLRFGLYATDAGLTAIGIEDAAPAIVAADTPEKEPAAATPRGAKTSTVLALLRRAEGASRPRLKRVRRRGDHNRLVWTYSI